MSSFSVKRNLIASIATALNFNQPVPSTDEDGDLATKEMPAWKILIYDTFTRDVITPIFSVGALRKLGVTLHLSAHSPCFFYGVPI